MKIITILLAAVCFSLLSFSQDDFKPRIDDPRLGTNVWANVGLSLESGFQNLKASNLTASINFQALYKLKAGLNITYKSEGISYREQGVIASQLEAGGVFFLLNKTRTSSVTLKNESSYDYESSPYTTTTNALQRISIGPRAGFVQLQQLAFATEKNHAIEGVFQHNAVGAHIGGQVSYARYVYGDAKRKDKLYGGVGKTRRTNIYADILILPGQTFSSIETGNEVVGVDVKSLGFRLGIEAMPYERRGLVQKNGLYYRFELGNRPFDGWYAAYTVGFSIRRKLKVLGEYSREREKE